MNTQQTTIKERLTEEKRSATFNVLSVLGLILILFIGLWATIQIVRFVPQLFSSASLPRFGSPELVVSLDKTQVSSNTPVTITWETKRIDATEGALTFAYACREGFHFETSRSDGGTVIPCNTSYPIETGARGIILNPISSVQEYIEVPLAVTFSSNAAGEESVRGTEALTVTDGVASIDTDTPDTTPVDTPVVTETTPPVVTTPVSPKVARPTYTTVPRASNPYGIADLSIQMIAIGSINPYTNQFEAKGVVRPYEQIGVKFAVTNLGDKETGLWSFIATLPTSVAYTYTSPLQTSILPGTRVEFFLTFTQTDTFLGAGKFITIQVDPFNQVPERSEFNNQTGMGYTVANY